jgi:AraC-like DNA-binding protein
MVYDNPNTLMKTISLHFSNPSYAKIETEGILMQLVAQFLREASPKFQTAENRINKVLRHIRTHINECFKIDDLAELIYLSTGHFIRLFKKELNISPTRYINQKKIERAQLQLITTDLSVKDIAYNLSFDDVSYFSRLFKQYAGVTPKEYRSKIQ